ncbi:MAG: hypothetical protein COA71_12785 [SAR86 cluster bacterium]|uniref:DUF5666 domain-containing protein n=1 Tax=SAR86 cluster bacterium TaxID=2030880 RepID=A0A2A5C7B3_9GAMM|nr:DUF4148 domain-containing protein [Gammaproteobacteria bacterium AH-315-E17]PCJ39759.1 MAG: hypothetical protein COA71_12785 [SAR86 cluster bacterium]
MKTKLRIVAVIFSLLVAIPATAHHSFFSQFDSSAPITLTGTITRVEWRNPHIWILFDVTNEDGSVSPWRCEGGAPNALVRNGFTANTLEVGEELTIYGYRAFNGENICNGRGWEYKGETIFGRPNDDGPAAELPNR